MPCPVARDIGELLNLSAGPAGNRASTPANAEAAGSGGKVTGAGGGGGGGGKRGRSSSLGNRWLHDVLEMAETLKAERVEIVLDEKVRLVLGCCFHFIFIFWAIFSVLHCGR